MERYRRSPFVKTIFSCRVEKKSLLYPRLILLKRFVEATVSKIKEETGAGFDCFITTPTDEKTKRSYRLFMACVKSQGAYAIMILFIFIFTTITTHMLSILKMSLLMNTPWE
jgi:hypothetical protein